MHSQIFQNEKCSISLPCKYRNPVKGRGSDVGESLADAVDKSEICRIWGTSSEQIRDWLESLGRTLLFTDDDGVGLANAELINAAKGSLLDELGTFM